MAAGKGNKHGGRKTRIKTYQGSKHQRQALEAKKMRRQVNVNHSKKIVGSRRIGGVQ